MLQIGSTLIIPAEPSHVFERFLDPDTMRTCIPGCVELERLDDAHYRGLLVNEIAHVRFNARFAAEITEIELPRLVHAVLTGEDRRLGSSLKINVILEVTPENSESRVTYTMDIALWGKLGRLGEPIVRRRSLEVERQFSAAFADAVTGRIRVAAEPAAAPDAPPSAAAPEAAAPDPAAAVAVAAAPPTAAPSGERPRRFWRNILADILEHIARKLR
jgi:uncharacterized protein